MRYGVYELSGECCDRGYANLDSAINVAKHFLLQTTGLAASMTTLYVHKVHPDNSKGDLVRKVELHMHFEVKS